MSELDDLYGEMKGCSLCKLRAGCTQVVTSIGCTDKPKVLIIGEAPGEDEDAEGEPFIGKAGQCLRNVLRDTGILNRSNCLITNTVKCRPPKNKFPSDDIAGICVGKWLLKEIELAKPERMILLGNTPLQFVANMTGITSCRGQWYSIRGIRTMATYHPSYVLRCDSSGRMMHIRNDFEHDIAEVADEAGGLK